MESKKTTTEGGTTAGVATLKAHLALYVADVEKSTEFYRLMFGTGPAKERRGYAKFDVQNPPLNLTLNEKPEAAGRGAVSHLGIQVASTADVLTLRDRWRAAGLKTFDEVGTNCCYAVQDKSWVTDPDGYEWEAFVVLEDNLPETRAGSCCATNEAEELEATAAGEGAVSCACATAPSTAGAPAAAGACCAA
jgi:extradiol dioxygenase family protein